MDCFGDAMGGFLIVGVDGFVAAFDHFHPYVAVFNEAGGEGSAGGILGAVDFCGSAARFEKIF